MTDSSPIKRKFIAVEDEAPLRLSPPLAENHKKVNHYRPSVGLREAMDVAMLLGVPLILTGEPGVGKTRAAYWLANELAVGEVLRHNVKSTTSGADLLYAFDDVSRFRDSAQSARRPLTAYLRFQPLGEAIVRAAGGRAILRTDAGEVLAGEALDRHRDLLAQAFGADWKPVEDAARVADLMPRESGFASAGPAYRVVLIDELDKAPLDTPNDLLAEVEDMKFVIPELGLQVLADPAVRPIVIITSNSEKSLPDPFMRRCAYFDVPLPDDETLKAIIEDSVAALKGGGQLLRDALELFALFREENTGLSRKPGASELLAWLEALTHGQQLAPHDSLYAWAHAPGKRVRDSFCAVFKGRDDIAKAEAIVARWTPAPAAGG
jgi:MoxR-like ATPase